MLATKRASATVSKELSLKTSIGTFLKKLLHFINNSLLFIHVNMHIVVSRTYRNTNRGQNNSPSWLSTHTKPICLLVFFRLKIVAIDPIPTSLLDGDNQTMPDSGLFITIFIFPVGFLPNRQEYALVLSAAEKRQERLRVLESVL